MSLAETTEAVVLKHWDYGEKDQIVCFLSKSRGRIQGIAKGAKSSRHRFAGALDLFSWTEIAFREKKGGSLIFLEHARLLSGFPGIRENYNAILLANGLLEMAYRFYKEPSPGDSAGFEILLMGLRTLEREGGKKEIFWRALLENLRAIGLQPDFERCVKCHGESSSPLSGFDLWGGGMVCEKCFTPSTHLVSVAPGLKEWLKDSSLNSEMSALNAEDESALKRILKEHLRIQMSLDLEWDRFHNFLS
jgi:DNA repair protein RecO (recombination protein O)